MSQRPNSASIDSWIPPNLTVKFLGQGTSFDCPNRTSLANSCSDYTSKFSSCVGLSTAPTPAHTDPVAGPSAVHTSAHSTLDAGPLAVHTPAHTAHVVGPPAATITATSSPSMASAPTSPNKHHMVTRAKNNIHNPVQKLNIHTQIRSSADFELTTAAQALKDPKWRQAMSEECDALVRNGTWELVQLDKFINIIGYASSSSSHTPSLPGPSLAHFLKLTESNYLLWSTQLRPFLIGHGLYKFVDGSAPAPAPSVTSAAPAEIESSTPNPTYLSWFQQDQLVVSYIVAILTEPMLSLVVEKSTAFEMWTSLNESFSQHSVVNAVNIRFQLMDMTKGTKTVSAYLQHAKSLSDSLAAINESVSSSDLVTAVLRGLGSDYAMIVTAILNFPPLPKFEDLRARLLSFESQLSRVKTVDSGSTTALSRGSSSNRGGRRGGARGHGRGRSPWQSQPDFSTFGYGHGNSWQQPHHGGRGLLGSHPQQWCPTCSTTQHSHATYPHRYHGPDSLTAPFAGIFSQLIVHARLRLLILWRSSFSNNRPLVALAHCSIHDFVLYSRQIGVLPPMVILPRDD
ncbi:hypothetical protein LWI29_001639 [Acer saccharum]|uniref:Retrotransposon Copia-like N-terminal domain-containing protein n=1 Tax=Acer saccharum TaxID=4024 RepID=A0AA39VSC2_ACESA|nr:hypothetical protein LWI29_001639 [Acer saccharum]